MPTKDTVSKASGELYSILKFFSDNAIAKNASFSSLLVTLSSTYLLNSTMTSKDLNEV